MVSKETRKYVGYSKAFKKITSNNGRKKTIYN